MTESEVTILAETVIAKLKADTEAEAAKVKAEAAKLKADAKAKMSALVAKYTKYSALIGAASTVGGILSHFLFH